ncbi:hypothetical protein ACIOUE_28570 [Streptomyces xanthochromogenes]|uniref:hypothetical protein n=1 Tax=Streptomyces xanthochromogenes TaxID=67384 RepID=UPI00380EE8AA
MRLRHTVGAALGALALIVTLPTSADAATGKFSYTFTNEQGKTETDTENNPASHKCIDLLGVDKPEDHSGAWSGRNATDNVATVYTDLECLGTATVIKKGLTSPPDVKFRSVIFNTF